MSYYERVYLARINKHGKSALERTQNLRERQFKDFLSKSIRSIRILIDGKEIFGSLQPNKQDEKSSTGYFLVQNGTNLESGQVFNHPETKTNWMIIYLHEDVGRGYERYLVAKVDREIEWKNPDGTTDSSICYIFGPLTRIIEDRFRNYKGDPTYREDIKSNHIVMPYTSNIAKDSYMIIQGEAYKIAGYDILSIPGVIYITISATFKKNDDPIPEEAEDNFWFTGVIE